MDIYSRLRMAHPFEYGKTITGKGGKNLAIPTDYADATKLPGVKLKGRGSRNKRIRMRNLPGKADRKRPGYDGAKTFILNKGGKKIVMMTVDPAQGATRKIQTSALRKAGSSIKKKTVIPMFVLQPSVRIHKRTRVRQDVRRLLPPMADRTAKVIVAEFYRAYAHGGTGRGMGTRSFGNRSRRSAANRVQRYS